MKKLITIFICISLVLSLCACASDAEHDVPAVKPIEAEAPGAGSYKIELFDNIHGNKYALSEKDTAEICTQIALAADAHGWRAIEPEYSNLLIETNNNDTIIITDRNGEKTYEYSYGYLIFPAENKCLPFSGDAAETVYEILKKHKDKMFRYYLSDILCEFDRVSEISVEAPGFDLDYEEWWDAISAFAKASKEQADKVIDSLSCLDGEFAKVMDPDLIQFDVSTPAILINAGSSTIFKIMQSDAEPGKVYLMMLNAIRGENYLAACCYETESDSFDIKALNATLSEILLNENVADVFLDDSKKTVNNAIATEWRYLFEKSFSTNGAIEEPVGQTYDVTIVIDNIAYSLDRETGIFARNDFKFDVSYLGEDTLQYFVEKYADLLS